MATNLFLLTTQLKECDGKRTALENDLERLMRSERLYSAIATALFDEFCSTSDSSLLTWRAKQNWYMMRVRRARQLAKLCTTRVLSIRAALGQLLHESHILHTAIADALPAEHAAIIDIDI